MKGSFFVSLRTCSLRGILLLPLLLPLETTRSQAPTPSISIFSVDSHSFPEITIHLLARDSGGVPMDKLTEDSFIVAEENSSVMCAVRKETLGAQIAFVADIGAGVFAPGATGQGRWSEMQSALEMFFSTTWMMSGLDSGSLILQESSGTRPIVSATADAGQLLSAVREYLPKESPEYSRGLKGIDAALEYFQSNTVQSERFRAVVFLTAGLQSATAEELAATVNAARAAGIPIYPILFRQTEESGFSDSLRTIASRSGGTYTYFNSSGTESLRDLAALLEAVREQYILTYRSHASESGTKVISISLAMAGAGNPAVGKYEVTVEPPQIEIQSPKKGEAPAIATSAPPAPETDATPTAPPVSGYRVEGAVSWPDAHARKITIAELLVNGKVASTLNDPESLVFYLSPESLPKNLGSSVYLRIRVTDELGLTAESEVVPVSLANSPFGSFCAKLPEALKNMFCPQSSAASTRANPSGNLLQWLAVILAGTAVVLVIFFRKPISGAAREAASAASDLVQEVSSTMRFRNRPSAPKAYLVDVENTAGAARTAFELFGTTPIGRSRKNADLIVQPNDPNSPISRLHCTVIEEDEEFFVRDDQSANGTYLNGNRLIPLERNALKEGDEIELGRVDRGGIKFRFQRSIPEANQAPPIQSFEEDATNRVAR